jgi:NADPH-dependent ferric siderophore reductase
VLLHGHGPGSSWGQHAAPGDPVEFVGPRGKLELTPAGWHLMVGDEAALPAFSALCAALPAHESAIVVVEVGDPSDELPIGADVRWVHRGSAPAGGSQLLAGAVQALTLPAGTGHGYLLGETRAMVALRLLLEARGLAHDALFVKGYWNLGRLTGSPADRITS